jgi:hypothetical protein
MHAWTRVFALLALVTVPGCLPASSAADVFPEFDYVATCKTDQPDSAGTGETLSKCTGEEHKRSSNSPERGPNLPQTKRLSASRKPISPARLRTSSYRFAFIWRPMCAPVFAAGKVA